MMFTHTSRIRQTRPIDIYISGYVVGQDVHRSFFGGRKGGELETSMDLTGKLRFQDGPR